MGKTFLTNLLNVIKINHHIRKIYIGQGDDYTTSCLFDYPLGKYKMIAIDLRKQQELDADLKKKYNKLILLQI